MTKRRTLAFFSSEPEFRSCVFLGNFTSWQKTLEIKQFFGVQLRRVEILQHVKRSPLWQW